MPSQPTEMSKEEFMEKVAMPSLRQLAQVKYQRDLTPEEEALAKAETPYAVINQWNAAELKERIS